MSFKEYVIFLPKTCVVRAAMLLRRFDVRDRDSNTPSSFPQIPSSIPKRFIDLQVPGRTECLAVELASHAEKMAYEGFGSAVPTASHSRRDSFSASSHHAAFLTSPDQLGESSGNRVSCRCCWQTPAGSAPMRYIHTHACIAPDDMHAGILVVSPNMDSARSVHAVLEHLNTAVVLHAATPQSLVNTLATIRKVRAR